MSWFNPCTKLWRPYSMIPMAVIATVIVVFLARPSNAPAPAFDRYWRGEAYIRLSAKDAFDSLSVQRKAFTYHLNKAAWLGSFVSAAQASPESPSLMLIILKALQMGLDSKMEKAGFSAEEKRKFRRYSCGILVSQGNYRGSNGFKFFPEDIARSKIEVLFTDVWPSGTKRLVEQLFRPKPSSVGFPPEGQNQYWRGMDSDDVLSLQRFMQSEGITIGNQFAVKKLNSSGSFVSLRFASGLGSTQSWKWKDYVDGRPWENFTAIRLSRGAYSAILSLVVDELNFALQFAENEHLKRSLELLVESLREGDLGIHIASGKEWVKAVNQQVDTYMGFTESYGDPQNLQLEYCSFVGIENPLHSQSFQLLTNRSSELTSRLPWSREFEPDPSKQSVTKSFSSLAVTSYVAKVLPRGVNLPNYEEVKLEGQKNFNLANVVEGKAKFLVMAFLNEEDSTLLRRLYVEAFTIKLAIHELLGHGSGLLLRKNEAGVANFNESLVDPTTGAKISHWYTPASTFASVFGNIASAYEETRANSIALYLACDPDVLAIFGHEAEKAVDICLAVYLSQVFTGFTALMYFDVWAGWLSAHSQSEYVILRALMERLPDFVTIEELDNQDIKITVNRTFIPSATKEAFKDFVQQIHIYRSTGNIQAAEEVFSKYSAVDEKWRKLREIVIARKAGLVDPAFVPGNIQTDNLGDLLEYKWIDYPESCDGLLESWSERFSAEELLKLQGAVEDYLIEDA